MASAVEDATAVVSRVFDEAQRRDPEHHRTWGLEGAEAILRLRALVANGDFAAYWRHHLAREHERVHRSLYGDARPHLALVA